jgi:hypothetical protein
LSEQGARHRRNPAQVNIGPSEIPLAPTPIRRYGIRYEHDFEQDPVVVGLLIAAFEARSRGIQNGRNGFPGGLFLFSWLSGSIVETDGDGNDSRIA